MNDLYKNRRADDIATAAFWYSHIKVWRALKRFYVKHPFIVLGSLGAFIGYEWGAIATYLIRFTY